MKQAVREIVLDADTNALASMEDASALLAVVGLPALMKKGPLRVSEGIKNNVAQLPMVIGKRMLAFLEATDFEKIKLNLPKEDLNRLRDEFASQIDESWLAEKLVEVEEEDQLAFGQMVSKAYAYLLSKIPPLPTSFRPTKPSDFVSATFMRRYRTISDPMTVVSDMEMGCLSVEQVKTLAEVYPNIYEMMKTALLSAATEVMSDPDYVIPYKKLKMVAILTLQPMVGASLQEVLQSGFQAPEEGESPPPGPTKPSESLTQSQRVEFGR